MLRVWPCCSRRKGRTQEGVRENGCRAMWQAHPGHAHENGPSVQNSSHLCPVPLPRNSGLLTQSDEGRGMDDAGPICRASDSSELSVCPSTPPGTLSRKYFSVNLGSLWERTEFSSPVAKGGSVGSERQRKPRGGPGKCHLMDHQHLGPLTALLLLEPP